jgi:radical SAM protein with 4Fe4S-binding SPASM domain
MRRPVLLLWWCAYVVNVSEYENGWANEQKRERERKRAEIAIKIEENERCDECQSAEHCEGMQDRKAVSEQIRADTMHTPSVNSNLLPRLQRR